MPWHLVEPLVPGHGRKQSSAAGLGGLAPAPRLCLIQHSKEREAGGRRNLVTSSHLGRFSDFEIKLACHRKKLQVFSCFFSHNTCLGRDSGEMLQLSSRWSTAAFQPVDPLSCDRIPNSQQVKQFRTDSIVGASHN